MKSSSHELVIDRVAAPDGAPFGAVHVVAGPAGVCAIDFAGCEARMHRLLARRFGGVRLVDGPDPCGASTRLRAYFDGALEALDDLAVDPGGTAFQAAAWRALRAIPAGQTASYRQQAARIGRPAAVRAIGAANGNNPIAIALPCHRVVGSDGALTGYAGGLAAKRWLLDHEARHAARARRQRAAP
ncbi:MAG: methylated-DNA--[protein]-cysteine S-methyltransferase [Burkholderiales bacterium]|nr:methylated-DNA--[protein]-cysteine S-methyltransferase [Burkholderiales bacterium]